MSTRAAQWDATRLPVPAEVRVYTRAAWERLSARPRDVVWVSGRPSCGVSVAEPGGATERGDFR